MRVDAAQIAAAQGHAVTVEEFEDLDRDLAAVVDSVAKLRRGELRRPRAGARGRRAISTISATASRRKK